MSSYEIEFLGAAQTVTGSMHLIRTPHGTLLLDCGFYQGRRQESREKNAHLPKAALEADVLLLSHAHVDHSGSIPTLVKRGFRGDVYTTPATRDLCAHMLRDSARIQVGDAEYLNEKFKDDPSFQRIEPLYDEQDAIKALRRFAAMPYGKTFSPLPGVQCTFIDAGHILGSAQILLELGEGTTKKRLLFSGDLGRKGLPILRDPETPKVPCDYIVMESTYGNRVHADVHSMHDSLERVVKATIAKKGKIVIPAFALGRTQEIVFALNQLKHAGRLPDIPVFIDSPLSMNVTEVFKLHPECFDDEANEFMDEHGDIFNFSGVTYVQSRDESIALNRLRDSAIIISASGMCEAGRVLHHLRNTIEDEKNTIVIVGFQARHTLGRKIVERLAKVKIFGVERWLRADVEVLNAFSAHADKNELLSFAQTSGKDAKKIFLVHGEPEQQEPLAKEMVSAGLASHVALPGEVAAL